MVAKKALTEVVERLDAELERQRALHGTPGQEAITLDRIQGMEDARNLVNEMLQGEDA